MAGVSCSTHLVRANDVQALPSSTERNVRQPLAHLYAALEEGGKNVRRGGGELVAGSAAPGRGRYVQWETQWWVKKGRWEGQEASMSMI